MGEITRIVRGMAGPSGGVTAAQLAEHAPIADPTFTGTVTVPTLAVTANTTIGGTLAVNGSVSLGDSTADTITLAGHIKTIGSAPSITVGAALGTGGSVGASILFGNDTRGVIQLTAGTTSLTTGILGTFNFFRNRDDSNYIVILTAADGDAADLKLWTNQAGQNTVGFTLRTNTAPTSGTVYLVSYVVLD